MCICECFFLISGSRAYISKKYVFIFVFVFLFVFVFVFVQCSGVFWLITAIGSGARGRRTEEVPTANQQLAMIITLIKHHHPDEHPDHDPDEDVCSLFL